MSRYIISPEASQDLDEISDYFLSRMRNEANKGIASVRLRESSLYFP
jgi:hypothetical protein